MNVKFHTLAVLLALGASCEVPLRAADLAPLVASMAKYESGQSCESLQAFEKLLRDAVGKPALLAELEGALIPLLAPGTTFEAKRFACQQLAAAGTAASLPALANLLKDEETAGIACLALEARPWPEAVAILRQALGTARGPARLQIMEALAHHRDQASVKAMAGLARDGDPALASAAILALGKIGGAEAHAVIGALRSENNAALTMAVTEASLRVAEQLAAAGDRAGATGVYEAMLASSRPEHIRRGAFAALLRLDGDGGEKRILDALQGQESLLKPIAIAAAGSLKSGKASEQFAAKLPGLAPQEQVWMIEALAVRGDARALEAIRGAVASSDATVRSAAVAALGRLNDEASVSLLCAALEKAQNGEERDAVVAALGQIRGSKADEAILSGMSHAGGEARCELILLTGRRGNHGAVSALLTEAGSEDEAAAKAAFQALGRLATAADVPAMLERLLTLRAAGARSEAETATTRVLLTIKDPSERGNLILAALTGCSQAEARGSLLRQLPAAGNASALAALKVAMADKDAAVRETAVRVLAAWPDDAPWDTLMAVCRQPESTIQRALAYRGLVRMAGTRNAQPDEALLQRYGELLSLAGNASDSKLALGALAGAATPGALPLALAQLSNPAVRAEAAEAVKKIAAAIKAQHPQAAQEALKRLTSGGK